MVDPTIAGIIGAVIGFIFATVILSAPDSPQDRKKKTAEARLLDNRFVAVSYENSQLRQQLTELKQSVRNQQDAVKALHDYLRRLEQHIRSIEVAEIKDE